MSHTHQDFARSWVTRPRAEPSEFSKTVRAEMAFSQMPPDMLRALVYRARVETVKTSPGNNLPLRDRRAPGLADVPLRACTWPSLFSRFCAASPPSGPDAKRGREEAEQEACSPSHFSSVQTVSLDWDSNPDPLFCRPTLSLLSETSRGCVIILSEI